MSIVIISGYVIACVCQLVVIVATIITWYGINYACQFVVVITAIIIIVIIIG
jgi:hypothetical protein